MNKQQRLLLLAAAIGIVATFMPWVSVSAGAFGYSMNRSQNGFHGIGILYFLTMIAVLGTTYGGNQLGIAEKSKRFAMIGGGILCLICLLISYTNATDQTSGGFGLVNASPGTGLILSAIAALALLLIPVLMKNTGESLQSDISSFKNGLKSLQSKIPPLGHSVDKKQNRMAELEKLINWRNAGTISQEEFEDLKSKII